MKHRQKVRIAVVLDAEGNWAACGYSGSAAEDMRSTAIDCVPGEAGDNELRTAWVTAEVEVDFGEPESVGTQEAP